VTRSFITGGSYVVIDDTARSYIVSSTYLNVPDGAPAAATGTGVLVADVALAGGTGNSAFVTSGSGALTSVEASVGGDDRVPVTGTGVLVASLPPPIVVNDPIADGATVHIDFVHGPTGFVLGLGNVDIATLLGNDPNYPESDYYPEGITDYGYVFYGVGSYPPCATNELLAAILRGDSVVIKLQTPPPGGDRYEQIDFRFYDDAGNYYAVFMDENPTRVGFYTYASAVAFNDVWFSYGEPGNINALGFSFLQRDHIDFAVNDLNAATQPQTVDDTPGPLSTFWMSTYAAIASITTFPRLPLADLKTQTARSLYGEAVPVSPISGIGYTPVTGTGELVASLPFKPVIGLDPIAEGATVHVDYVHGPTGYVLGRGNVDVDTLLGHDPNLPYSGYDPSGLTEYGYVSYGDPPAAINELLAAILGGDSVVIKIQTGPGGGAQEDFYFGFYVGEDNYASIRNSETRLVFTTQDGWLNLDNVWSVDAATGTVNALGFNLVDTYFDLAANDIDAITKPLTAADLPVPLEAMLLDANGPIASVTTFPRLSLADLKARTMRGLYGEEVLVPSSPIEGSGIVGDAGVVVTGTGALASLNAVAIGVGDNFVRLRPDGDVALDGWTDQTGGTSDIFATLDEAVVNDLDYVQSPPLGAVASYVGPGDIEPASSWWGLRAYSAATIGTRLVRVVRDDDAEKDFGSLADGSLNVAGIAAFIGGGTARLLYLYDQGTNGAQHLVAASPTAHPTLILSGVGGKPQAKFLRTHGMGKNAIPTTSQPYTISVVARRTADFNIYNSILGSNSYGTAFADGANYIVLYAGSGVCYIGGMPDNQFNSCVAVYDGAASEVYGNGSVRPLEFASSPGTGAISGQYALTGMGGSPLTGDFREGGIWPVHMSVAKQAALDANQIAAWAAASASTLATADLKVRLFEGGTLIAEWTHLDVAETFTDAEQTLTAPQVAAISDFANLFAELDDNNGNVYRFAIGDPPGGLVEPVKVKYRYKKLDA
jgi:hypothetical protein